MNKWNWKLLSYNPSVPWSIDLMIKYKEKLNFTEISGNKGVKWNKDILSTFENELLFGTIETEEDGFVSRIFGIDNSKNLKISNEIIEQYSDKWNWKYLGRNENIQWTPELFNKFKEQLDLGNEYLQPYYKNIWNRLFESLINRNNLNATIQAIKDKKQFELEEEQRCTSLEYDECLRKEENTTISERIKRYFTRLFSRNTNNSEEEDLPF